MVRLRPLGTGIEAALHVRPFGMPGTPAFPVGDGPVAPLAEVEGRAVRAERDFEEEIHAARALVRACPTLRERGGIGARDLGDHGEVAGGDREAAVDLLDGDFGFRQAIGLAHQMGKIDCSYKEFNDASIETLLLLLRQVDRVDEILTFSNEFQKKMPRLLVKKAFEITYK